MELHTRGLATQSLLARIIVFGNGWRRCKRASSKSQNNSNISSNFLDISQRLEEFHRTLPAYLLMPQSWLNANDRIVPTGPARRRLRANCRLTGSSVYNMLMPEININITQKPNTLVLRQEKRR